MRGSLRRYLQVFQWFNPGFTWTEAKSLLGSTFLLRGTEAQIRWIYKKEEEFNNL